jgi:hypothetical protein
VHADRLLHAAVNVLVHVYHVLQAWGCTYANRRGGRATGRNGPAADAGRQVGAAAPTVFIGNVVTDVMFSLVLNTRG